MQNCITILYTCTPLSLQTSFAFSVYIYLVKYLPSVPKLSQHAPIHTPVGLTINAVRYHTKFYIKRTWLKIYYRYKSVICFLQKNSAFFYLFILFTNLLIFVLHTYTLHSIRSFVLPTLHQFFFIWTFFFFLQKSRILDKKIAFRKKTLTARLTNGRTLWAHTNPLLYIFIKKYFCKADESSMLLKT